MRRPPAGVYVCADGLAKTRRRKGRWGVRVLVAYEEAYRSYRQAIVRVIRGSRPHFEVLGADPRGLAGELERFEPHAVVSGSPSAEYAGCGRGAWVELPADPARAGEICVGGEHEARSNPDLAEMLEALDEAEERLRRGALGEAC